MAAKFVFIFLFLSCAGPRRLGGFCPGGCAAERALFRDLAVTHLVAKNSGGPARDKLDAARDLGLEVLLVAPPPLPLGQLCTSAREAADWIEGLA
ncbi:precorrin-6A/cobalt-precorrin-6A reductase [Mangrovicoccus ximenensis]|uniref:precorrin-6A/cobalt-precorrin-6A reductase n=1 Tax=Mangrovicoccus ximenensis TaxID=1911570 RepID=UPI000D345D26|nr:precorrin-6A/cobalt-precorrin-6A reductase [Mangrovicoccus ximenensis]